MWTYFPPGQVCVHVNRPWFYVGGVLKTERDIIIIIIIMLIYIFWLVVGHGATLWLKKRLKHTALRVRVYVWLVCRVGGAS